MKPMVEFRQSSSPGTLELYIYDDVQKEKLDRVNWEYVESETSAEYVRNQVEKSGVSFINIYINSRGGSVMEGVAIYNILTRNAAYKTVYIDGFACSIASVIAMAANRVVMPKNTVMMIHEVWMTVSGNAAKLRKYAEDLEVINNASRQAYLLKANGKITEDTLAELMSKETWLTAQQCMEYGFADEYAEQDADMEKAKQMMTQGIQESAQQLEEPEKPENNSALPENKKTINLMRAFACSLNRKGE